MEEKEKKMETIKTGYSEKLHPMPKNIWRPELTSEQKIQHYEDLQAGRIPF